MTFLGLILVQFFKKTPLINVHNALFSYFDYELTLVKNHEKSPIFNYVAFRLKILHKIFRKMNEGNELRSKLKKMQNKKYNVNFM